MSYAATCSCGSRAALGSRAAFLPAQRPAVGGRRRGRAAAPAAALSPEVVEAVVQQGVAYVAVLGGEATITGLSTPAGTPGRPTVPQTLLGAVGTAAAVVMIQQDGVVGTAGCVVGALTGAVMLSIMIGRVQKTPYNAEDWPGAKAWPAVMGLISFFSLAVFFQGLQAALS